MHPIEAPWAPAPLGDVVELLRRDQLRVRELLSGWDCHAADPPGTLRPWPVGEVLPETVHDIWVREHPGGPWRFQRRLAPEVQLLYKSREPRPKDERDFTEVLPFLSGEQRAWLRAVLPDDHPWRKRGLQ